MPVQQEILKKGFENYSQALFFEKRIKSWKKRSSIEKMIKKSDNLIIARSSNGRTTVFGTVYLGSNPSWATQYFSLENYHRSGTVRTLLQIKRMYHGVT